MNHLHPRHAASRLIMRCTQPSPTSRQRRHDENFDKVAFPFVGHAKFLPHFYHKGCVEES